MKQNIGQISISTEKKVIRFSMLNPLNNYEMNQRLLYVNKSSLNVDGVGLGFDTIVSELILLA